MRYPESFPGQIVEITFLDDSGCRPSGVVIAWVPRSFRFPVSVDIDVSVSQKRWVKRLIALFDTPVLLAVFAALSWSGNHIIGRAVAGHVPPFWLSMMRWLLPTVLILAFGLEIVRRDWPAIRCHWKALLFLALTGGTFFTLLQYVGLQYTAALNVSVLNSLTPVAMVAAAAVVFRDYIVFGQLLGLLISMLGVLTILSHGDWHSLAHLEFNKGDILIVLNMAIFGVYAACLRLRPQMHWLSFAFVIAFVSTITTIPFAIWEFHLDYRPKFDLVTVAAALYVAIFPGFLVVAAWARCIDQIGSNRTGPFLHLIPLFSAGLATILLGERIAGYHVMGLGLILTGVWLASRSPASPQQ